MLLGDVLSEIEHTSIEGGAAILFDDLVLFARVNEAAARQGIDAESYMIAAVRKFERGASSDDWTTLISAITAGTNPGATCMKRIIEWQIMKDGQE